MNEITSINNSFIKELLSLKDKQTRYLKREYLVEGYHLVKEAEKKNLLNVVLSSNKDSLDEIKAETKYFVTPAIIKKLSSTKTPQDIIGVVKIKDEVNILDLLKKDELKLVILDDVNDPGNLGTIIRTTCALGYDAIIASNQTVDFYNEKVLRATQGAIFRLPLIKTDLLKIIPILKENGVKIFGTSLKSSTSVLNVQKSAKLGVIFGNEANGVSDEVLSLTNQNIIIPMKNDVESLNVSIAASLIMWELIK